MFDNVNWRDKKTFINEPLSLNINYILLNNNLKQVISVVFAPRKKLVNYLAIDVYQHLIIFNDVFGFVQFLRLKYIFHD